MNDFTIKGNDEHVPWGNLDERIQCSRRHDNLDTPVFCILLPSFGLDCTLYMATISEQRRVGYCDIDRERRLIWQAVIGTEFRQQELGATGNLRLIDTISWSSRKNMLRQKHN